MHVHVQSCGQASHSCEMHNDFPNQSVRCTASALGFAHVITCYSNRLVPTGYAKLLEHRHTNAHEPHTHAHEGEHNVRPVVQGDNDEDSDEGMEHVVKMEEHALGEADLYVCVCVFVCVGGYVALVCMCGGNQEPGELRRKRTHYMYPFIHPTASTLSDADDLNCCDCCKIWIKIHTHKHIRMHT